MIGLVTDSFEITSLNDEMRTNLTDNRNCVIESNEVCSGYMCTSPLPRGGSRCGKLTSIKIVQSILKQISFCCSAVTLNPLTCVDTGFLQKL